jgi:hypothetical protein
LGDYWVGSRVVVRRGAVFSYGYGRWDRFWDMVVVTGGYFYRWRRRM